MFNFTPYLHLHTISFSGKLIKDMLLQTLDLNMIHKYDKQNFGIESYDIALIEKLVYKHHAQCYVIAEDAAIVGYLIYGIDHATLTCDIIRLCIFSEYRHKQYAYNNIYELIHNPEMKDYTFTLNVNATNSIAHNLYIKLGFKDYGRLDNYYRDGNDAICMYYKQSDN